jgi:hypothetical protein
MTKSDRGCVDWTSARDLCSNPTLNGGFNDAQIAILEDPVDFNLVGQMLQRDNFIRNKYTAHAYTGLLYNRTIGMIGTYPQNGWGWNDGSSFDIGSLDIILGYSMSLYSKYPGNVSLDNSGNVEILFDYCYKGYYYATCQIPSTFCLNLF